MLYLIEGDGGGAVTHVLTLAKELSKKQGIMPILVFLTYGPSVNLAAKMGLRAHLIPKRLFFDPTLVWKLRRILVKGKIDILHTHTIRGNFYGRISLLFFKKPLINITTVHSHIIDELKGKNEFGIKEKLLCKREAFTTRFVNQFICVSEDIQNKLLSVNLPRHKVTTIVNGVVLPELAKKQVYDQLVRNEFSIAQSDVTVGIIGRLVPVKNHYLFIKAAKFVCERRTNVKFLVIGDGQLLEELKRKTKELQIDNKVIFTGWRNDIQILLCAIDIYVITSIVEGLNISVLEAMASGKPVIGTCVKGVYEIIIQDKTGIIVPPDNTELLATAILRLVNNRDERLKMGLNGRALVKEKYSLKKMVEDTYSVYQRHYFNKIDKYEK